MEYVDDYLQLSKDYSLTRSQKLQYLHNLLQETQRDTVS